MYPSPPADKAGIGGQLIVQQRIGQVRNRLDSSSHGHRAILADTQAVQTGMRLRTGNIRQVGREVKGPGLLAGCIATARGISVIFETIEHDLLAAAIPGYGCRKSLSISIQS